MNTLLKRSITGIAISVVTVVGATSLVYAVDDTNDTPVTTDEQTLVEQRETEKKELLKEKAKERAAERAEAQKERMQAKCEQHQANLNKLVKNIQARSQRAYDRITKISELIKKFYVKKELNVAEYDTLIADVEAKRVAAKANLDTLLANSGIDCDAESPRTMVKQFRSERKEKIEAMKAYRQSVRKLLQTVRQAAIDQLSNRLEAKEEKE
jgi:hypothetical protein